jgi:hypothetical protein
MSSKIELESAVGQCSCFSVILALEVAKERVRVPLQATTAASGSSSHHLRILLAEHNQ